MSVPDSLLVGAPAETSSWLMCFRPCQVTLKLIKEWKTSTVGLEQTNQPKPANQEERLAEPHFLEIRLSPLAEMPMVMETNFPLIRIGFQFPRNK